MAMERQAPEDDDVAANVRAERRVVRGPFLRRLFEPVVCSALRNNFSLGGVRPKCCGPQPRKGGP